MQTLAENFLQNGIPMTNTREWRADYTNPGYQPLTNDSIFAIAITHFDTALTLSAAQTGDAREASAVLVKQAASVAKARALVNLGQVATAAPLVSTGSSFRRTFSICSRSTRRRADNNIWSLNNKPGRATP